MNVLKRDSFIVAPVIQQLVLTKEFYRYFFSVFIYVFTYMFLRILINTKSHRFKLFSHFKIWQHSASNIFPVPASYSMSFSSTHLILSFICSWSYSFILSFEIDQNREGSVLMVFPPCWNNTLYYFLKLWMANVGNSCCMYLDNVYSWTYLKLRQIFDNFFNVYFINTS